MNPSHDADEIRRQMREIRQDVGRDVNVLMSRVHDYASWRYHWRNHPWVCLGTAAALGFIAVPARTRTVVRDPAALLALPAERRLVAEEPPPMKTANTFAGVVLTMLGRAMIQGTMKYIEKNGSQIVHDIWDRKTQTS
jgi:hypothetical protein